MSARTLSLQMTAGWALDVLRHHFRPDEEAPLRIDGRAVTVAEAIDALEAMPAETVLGGDTQS